jgi:hypothetical protein
MEQTGEFFHTAFLQYCVIGECLKYDNLDAIHVKKVVEIPIDYPDIICGSQLIPTIRL